MRRLGELITREAQIDHLWEWTSQGEQEHLDLITDISINFAGESQLKLHAALNLVRKDISETVLYSGEWWEATYQERIELAEI